MSEIFSFPSTVNEKAARSVGAGVALASLAGLFTGWMWLLPILAVGFWLRVGFGPRFSPLALFATKIAAPRLGEAVDTPGPPKRFAQSIGAVTTTAGTVLAVIFGIPAGGYAVFGIMALFAGMEAGLGLCVGCKIFSVLMRTGVIPESICEECADISLHRQRHPETA